MTVSAEGCSAEWVQERGRGARCLLAWVCVSMAALPPGAGMLGLPLGRSRGKGKGSAGETHWASVQPVDQGDAKRDRSPRLPQKLRANS